MLVLFVSVFCAAAISGRFIVYRSIAILGFHGVRGACGGFLRALGSNKCVV